MYIKFELYRAKNGELFDQEMIEWPLVNDKDLIELDDRLKWLLTQHIQSLPIIKKYGIAYVGEMKIVGIEINDNDDLGGLDEEQFRKYILEIMPYMDVKWNKTIENGVN